MSEKQQFDSALLTPKHWIAVAVILASGMVGGALILRAPQTATQPTAAAHADADDDDDDHDEEGVIALTEAQAKMVGIALATAGPAVVRTNTLLPGEIRFDEDRTAHVVPRAAGVVESVHAQLGEQVKKDQLLAVIQSAAVADQRSELQTARQRLALAQTTYQREKQLWEEKISAEQDYFQARQAVQEAEIAVRNASQRLSAIGVSVAATGGPAGVSRYELRAPFEGVVVEKHLTVGESVNESTASFTITGMRYVWAEMSVSAPQLPLVQVGAPVRVRATAFDLSAEGKVAYVGALIGELTRTSAARVALANPQDLWRPGLFVSVEVMTEESQVPIAVNSNAIQWLDAQESVVFVLVEHGYKAQPVRLGRSDAEFTEILTGLSAGQTYVSEGAFMLKAELGKSSADHGH